MTKVFSDEGCGESSFEWLFKRDCTKQVEQNSENRKGIIGWNLDRDVEFNCVSLIRYKRSNRKCSVPHSAMVSAEIADIIQCQ